ncbi:DUF2975 domain-containing protein [Schleiferilactobacillus harbinensis]|uniref:DUF2975 domain-containing protein n=1 Tax=Schleiferilactobacillus harbinensis TaxID=304207 RepID=UPI00345E7DC8
MKLRSWFLQACLVGAGAFAIMCCVFIFPRVPEHFVYQYHNLPVAVIFTVGLYGSAAAFFAAACYSSRLLSALTHRQAFTIRALQLLSRAKWGVVAMTGSLFPFFPQIVVILIQGEDPGSAIVFTGMVVIAAVVAVFLTILQRLWETALQIKDANDAII